MAELKVSMIFTDRDNSELKIKETYSGFYKDEFGEGYLVSGSNIKKLVRCFMVEGGSGPMRLRDLKDLGITIDANTTSIEVINYKDEIYSYKINYDNSFVEVPKSKVLSSSTHIYALIDGVVKKLYTKQKEEYSINGIQIKSKYQYNKLLGIEM